jgi:hypothetical protein
MPKEVTSMTHLILVPLAVALAWQVTLDLPMTVDLATERSVAGGPQADLTLEFDGDLPESIDVVRLVRSPGPAGWQVADSLRRAVRGGATTIGGPAGAETLLLIRAPGLAGYVLEGPFRWPAHPSARAVRPVWRRTVRGTAPGVGSPTWVGGSPDPAPDAWPRCVWLADGVWECVGVPLGLAGVVSIGDGAQQVHAMAPGMVTTSGIETTQVVAAAWGRVLVAGRTDRVRLTAADAVTVDVRRIVVPRTRPRSLRLNAGADDRLVVRRLGESAFWIGGEDVPDDAWVEIAASDRAPVRLDAPELAAAPPTMPVRVDLAPAVSIGGRVMADDGAAAPGAVVTLWRIVTEGHTATDRDPPPRRVFVTETASDADGGFDFGGLADDPHEIVALHASLGRGERRLGPGERDVDVRLKRPTVAIGEVVRDGQPVAGVPVKAVPDLQEAAASEDLTLLAGGQATSGPDGRFRVAVPSRGRAEVRVGEEGGVRRFPLGPAESLPAVIDLGRIPLDGTLITVHLVLEASDGCDVRLSGPLGSAGLSLVPSLRIGPAMFEVAVPEPGQWLVSATCGGQTRIVQPTAIDVKGTGPLTVPLTWR